MSIFLAILGTLAAVACLFLVVIFRQQIGQFLRAIANPPLNNWVLLGLWIGVVVLFVVALCAGDGEPFGTRTLREASEQHKTSAQVTFYNNLGTTDLFTNQSTPAPTPATSHGTWLWWWLFFSWLGISIIFIPVAFHDEIGNAWNMALERWSQRTRRIPLRPRPHQPYTFPGGAGMPSTTTPPITVTPRPSGFFGNLTRRLREHLPSDLLAEFVNDFFGATLRGIFRR